MVKCSNWLSFMSSGQILPPAMNLNQEHYSKTSLSVYFKNTSLLLRLKKRNKNKYVGMQVG